MGKRDITRAVDEILHYVWDPIGVAGVPQARDEYSAYVPRVVALLARGISEGELSLWLQRLAEEHIGTSRQPDRADEAALALVDWQDHLRESQA
jgi:hypothetical protein